MYTDNIVLIADLECSCWRTNSEQPKTQFSEIIEIGITEIDIKQLKILRTCSILVKPKSSKISKFCTELTTLTQEQVDSGITLAQACEKLKLRFKSENRVWSSWGNYDRKQFYKNCKDYNINYPFGQKHMNISNMFALLYGLSEDPNMEDALKYINLPLVGVQHRGDDDSRNIANIFLYILRRFRAK
jgi:inhibitor of KinA sporulation pathway (predicted exonuclease)